MINDTLDLKVSHEIEPFFVSSEYESQSMNVYSAACDSGSCGSGDGGGGGPSCDTGGCGCLG